MKQMDLKSFHYLLTIADCRNLTRAAEKLYLSQPALSKFLRKIEGELGSPLFHRSQKILTPTYLGIHYLAYANKIIALENDWDRECRDLLSDKKGRLAVAVPLMRGSCLIPETLSRFYEYYPQVQVTLLEQAYGVETKLTSQAVDFAIYSDTRESPQYISDILCREEIVLVLPSGHKLAEKAETRENCRYPWLALEHLEDQPFVLQDPEQTTGKLTQNLFKESKIYPKIVLQTRNSALALEMVARGLALTVAPESYVRHQKNASFDIYSFGFPKTETTLFAVHQKGRYLSLYARFFIETAKTVMRDILSEEKTNHFDWS